MLVTQILRRSNSWPEYNNQIQTLGEKEKGDCFEALTRYYLQIHPTYSTKLRNVWLLPDVPYKIKSLLNLPSADEGIDLIAETKDNKYWAIQCKYRADETKSLTHGDLATFATLSFNICRNIEFALVCTTADRFSYKLKRYGERLSLCCGDVWRSLDQQFFQRLHAYLDGRTVPPAPTQPRAHQQRAISNAYDHFIVQGNDRGKLIMPCGTGKSLAAYWIAERLAAKTILVAVPSLGLVRQTLELWTTESQAQGREFNWICVCSDPSVKELRQDAPIVFVQDLGIRVHTDPEEIASWLKRASESRTLVLTTYQSGRAISEASRKANFVFDLGIMDEAHKTVGKRSAPFSHLLDDANIAINHRVFMTATERRYKGSSDQILSMENPDVYGDTFELLTFKKALEAEPPILSDYRIVTIAVTRSEVAQLIQDNVLVIPDPQGWDGPVEAETLATVVALRKVMQRFPIRHAVSFHSSIARARIFKEVNDNFQTIFTDSDDLETFHVSGNIPTSVRTSLLEDFAKSDRALVTNARCLTEGIDIKDIDCVLFADPRKSAVDIVQATGRALRLSHAKKFGYVLVPLFIEDGSTSYDLRESTAFSDVIRIVQALATNDERIIEDFYDASRGVDRNNRENVFVFDVPIALEIEPNSFADSIELMIWSSLAKLSWRPFVEAREFARTLTLPNQKEWRQYCKGEFSDKVPRPADIPVSPDRTYQDKGWNGWGDWLGSGAIANQDRIFLPFVEAREFVHTLELENGKGWRKYCRGQFPEKPRRPDNIPADPAGTYDKKGWKGMGDWLGTGRVANQNKKFLPFKKAREFVRSLGLASKTVWKLYCNGEISGKDPLPSVIPASPRQVYKHEWTSWGDWLGTGTTAPKDRRYRTFEAARSFARGLGITNSMGWRKYTKGQLTTKPPLPADIPANPPQVYKDTWIGWGDWLGTYFRATWQRNYRPFVEARLFVWNLELKTIKEWRRYCKGQIKEKTPLPEDIPSDPYSVYKRHGEWVDWGNWLGTDFKAVWKREWRPFEQARSFVRSLKLRTQTDWQKYCRGELLDKPPLPPDIPKNPRRPYKNSGWVSMGDWLGTGTVAWQVRDYLTYEEARQFVHTLGLKNYAEWKKYCKGLLPQKGILPSNIPMCPYNTYKKKGWRGSRDWLGP